MAECQNCKLVLVNLSITIITTFIITITNFTIIIIFAAGSRCAVHDGTGVAGSPFLTLDPLSDQPTLPQPISILIITTPQNPRIPVTFRTGEGDGGEGGDKSTGAKCPPMSKWKMSPPPLADLGLLLSLSLSCNLILKQTTK